MMPTALDLWLAAGIICLPFAILIMWLGIKLWQRSDRVSRRCCAKCGYDLRASKGRCPECGRETPDYEDVTC